MATGDLKNNLRCLQSKLKLINYPKDMDMKGISKGLAQEFLPLLHYILLDFSHPMAGHIINNDIQLYGKSDDKFLAAVYKVLRDIFHYKPSITRQQFFSRGFAEHKIILVVDLIRMVKEKHKELSKGTIAARTVSGSCARLQEQIASIRSVVDSDQPRTPDLLAASTSETPVFLPASQEASKVIEKDTGYNTAETSPTSKIAEDQGDARKASISVNELRAKFESSSLQKQESVDSKLSDMDIEDNPVIQALVKQIVHLEDQLTDMSEEIKAWKVQVEKTQSDMQARLVLMQNSVTLLESKLTTEAAEAKPVRSALTQGIAHDITKALQHPFHRRPEDVPLPDSPAIPRTPNQTPADKTPHSPLSISAVIPEQDVLAACKVDLEPEHDDIAQGIPQRYQPNGRPISVVGPIQSLVISSTESNDPDVVTILGASSRSPVDMRWIHPSSSTPIESTAGNQGMETGVMAAIEPGEDPTSNDDDIDEGLVDVEDGDLGDYIVESVRDYSHEIQETGDNISEANEAEEVNLEEEEIDEVAVRDKGQADASVDLKNAASVYSQVQKVQDMLVSTQQMLAMNTSLTKPSPEDV
ncbi:centrosomal protein of 44 kDa-like isoform X2 [Acanthaster planci]|uniref:Centrosomal protein of 44 kDa n=1 Tax=Acanthaster planci TaxID=133434 RepID=A0A8B7Z2G7_ACAPL|nr:centrosomal protein of 44 kDa-like isoform X2 [Acanthaster planci]